MNEYITIYEEDPYSTDAKQLMDELSDILEDITGSSGRGSFDPVDVCGSRAVFIIARNINGNAVGCGALRMIDDYTAEVKRMYAKESGQGIGSKMLSYLERKALEMGYTTLKLETRLMNERAVAFYESMGYYRISNYGNYINRPEAVCFEKIL